MQKPQIIRNQYTKEYEEFLKVPEDQRRAYNQRIHSITQQDTNLILPECNPSYFDKVKGEADLNLTTYVWETPHKPKNLLFINHGLNGYIGSYQYLADKLSQNTSTVVIGHDTRHFGRSEGKPRGLIRNKTKLLQDLENVVQWGTNKYGRKLNIFLLGLSMGGMVALETANREKFNYKGAILIVPALVSTPIKTLKLGWKQFFKIAFMPESGISKPSYKNSCRHTQFIQTKVKSDKYIYHDQLRAGTARSLYTSMQNSKIQMEKFKLPYLFIQAGTDKLIDPFQIRDFQKLSKSSDKTHYFCQKMWHSCCFDQQFLKMTPQILKWIDSRSN